MTAGDHLATVHVSEGGPVVHHGDLIDDVDGLPRAGVEIGFRARQAGASNPRPPVNGCAPSGYPT